VSRFTKSTIIHNRLNLLTCKSYVLGHFLQANVELVHILFSINLLFYENILKNMLFNFMEEINQKN